MPDVCTLVSQLREVQAELVKSLQDEYFCEDLEAPAEAFGWSESQLREFFEAGGAAASSKAPVVPGQPGGGRQQPVQCKRPPIAAAAVANNLKSLVGGDGTEKYQAAVFATGMPDLCDGLFPPGDELLAELSRKYRPFVKHLPQEVQGGGFTFAPALEGWVVGDPGASHGIDMRLFIAPGTEAKLYAALRFSDYAAIGRGFESSVHGGAVETALDEATAELAKSKLFPVALTVKIEFKIAKKVMPQTTYLVECAMAKEWSKNLKYDVTGTLTERGRGGGKDVLIASCTATMANPAMIPGAGFD